MLVRINERKRWSIPPPEDPAKRAAQDEEIFQTARLVKSVFLTIRSNSCINIGFLVVVIT